MSEPARDSECRFTPAWQPGADANLQRAGKQPSAATCDCGHPQGWHRKNVGSCIECACPYFDDRDEQATDRSAAKTAPHELRLAWAFNDPGVVHLARYGTEETLCGKDALGVNIGRRSVTCVACKEQTL